MPEGEEIVPNILRTTTVGDVVKDQILREALANEKVSTVADRLSEHHISSCPVFSEDEEKKEFLGLVDFSDVVALLIHAEWKDVQEGSSVWAKFGNTPIVKAIDLGHRNPAVKINIGADLSDAVELIAAQNLRRLVVEDDNGTIVAILSPSQMMKSILSKLDGRLDTTLNETIANLDMCSKKEVLTVNKEESLLVAMHSMLSNQVSAIAIVDKGSGHLAGSVSMSDVKVLFRERKFKRLQQSCWKYIQSMRERSDFEVFPFFGVGETAKLQSVISKLLVTSVHHLYVVNKENTPIHVISFADVCKGLTANLD
mmetsp:Transcript_12163/g.14757  ORF Transcript_12163/g.14757 Transcript_12163/m.14757 type:complete len:312 (+) Transcript_12163:378-1313(+)